MPRLTVNDRPVEFDLDPDMPLLYALREALNLTGTKSGGVGGSDCSCGVCMVMVDGTALRSCQITLAEAEGRYITTIEGLSRDRSHPVQQALIEAQAVQCGYCTPGIVISAAALLRRNAAPSREDVIDAVPNMCRCGVYPRLVDAVQKAGRVVREVDVINAPPAPGTSAAEAAETVPAITPPDPGS